MVNTLFGWGWLGTLVLLLTELDFQSQAAEKKDRKTVIPKIASIARIKVGYSSMEDLERHLGKGKVTIGGHPNGARLWRVKGTSWIIHADAFCYSERGAVVDCFDITMDPGPSEKMPYARSTRDKLVWAGGNSLGLNEDNLLKFLEQNSWTPVKLEDGWLVTAEGYSPLTSDPLYPFNRWEVRFTMKEKSLVGISLLARVQKAK
jgi:hypothetical protein